MGWLHDARTNAWVFTPTYEYDRQYDFSIYPDFSNIQTTGDRPYNAENIFYINQKLKSIPIQQRATILANIIEESGGDPLKVDDTNKYRGLLQWDNTRYFPKSTDPNVELDNQIQYILDTYNNTTDRKSWNRNGDAYKSAQDAYDHFKEDNPKLDGPTPVQYGIHRAFTRGYVRPSGKDESVNNRYRVYQQVLDRLKGTDKNWNVLDI